MITAIWVAVAGAAGALARYGIAGVLNFRGYPWGTVAVNVVGSAALGVLVGYWGLTADTPSRVGIAVGLLGGFTTFSTFAMDTIYLVETGETALAMVSLGVSVMVGLGAAIGGLTIGRALAG